MRKIEKECYPESDGEEESKINKSFNEVLKLKDQQIESLTIEKLNLENQPKPTFEINFKQPYLFSDSFEEAISDNTIV